MKDKFSPDWIEVLKTPDNKCEGKVDGLKEKMPYQFRIKAHNKAGVSEGSDPTDTHICKHKNRKLKFPLFLYFFIVCYSIYNRPPLLLLVFTFIFICLMSFSRKNYRATFFVQQKIPL